MPDILDQSEVDALLEAVKKGNVATGAATPAAAHADAPRGQQYDFKRPQRIGKEQMRVLQNVGEVFARNFGTVLSGMTRAIAEVRLLAVEQITYGEFIASLPNPTYFNLLEIKPLNGEAIMEISPSAVFPIIDKLLGGGLPETSMPNRPLTQIEQNLAGAIAQRAIEQLREAWSSVADFGFSILRTEFNPQLIQARPANEAVAVARFEARIGKANGLINICFPFAVIEPALRGFATQTQMAQAMKNEAGDHSAQIVQNLSKAALEVVCYAAESTITLSDLLALRVGHIIQTDRPASGDMSLCIDGKLKFKCKPGIHNNHVAIVLNRPAEPNENT